MAGRKRTASASKSRRRARKNPTMIDGKWYFDDAEATTVAEAIKGMRPAKAPPKPKKSAWSAKDLQILKSLSGYDPKQKKIAASTADKLVEKLEHDKSLAADQSERMSIQNAIKKIKKMRAEPKAPRSSSSIADVLSNLTGRKEKSQLDRLESLLKGRGVSAAKKLKSASDVRYSKLPASIDKEYLLDLLKQEDEYKKPNPGKGGKKMAKAKKGKKKATKRKVKKAAGKKPARRKVKAKPARKVKRKSARRKARRLPLTEASAKAMMAGEKSARKYFKKHKKAKTGPKRGKKATLRWKRSNPGFAEAAMSIGKIAAAGAAAGVALQLANRFAKPMIDKIVPKALAELKVGNAPVGQILLSCLVPGLVAAGLKMVKHPMAQQVSDVIIVTTAANAGQRIVAGLLPAGMAGVEPMLMGVEPMLMGEADFGDADFGDADFGAIEQFSGVEPQLMGSQLGDADFGAIEQFSGYGAIQQFDGYGAIQQFSGDEDYAGEDFDGEDFDGESSHGLG